jgi:tRNA (guanine6-N2)-methyltransferase
MPATSRRQRTTGGPPAQRIEAVVAEGLEPIARDEIAALGRSVRFARSGGEPASGVLIFDYTGDLRALLRLRSISSLYLARSYAVPRPKGLLGDEHFRGLLAQIATARGLHPAGSFASLYISAAGTESAVMQRLRAELVASSGLAEGEEDGDLFIRLRRTPGAAEGWDALVRLAPRPLATRPWRVCNMEGALNGAVAHAMNLLTRPDPRDSYLNIGCGSATLLIERLLHGPARRAIGCDTSPAALRCATLNLAAAQLSERSELHSWDATALPLPDASIDVITSDLPFGHLVGSHAENMALYPALLRETARVARPKARCAILSHEVRLLERLLADSQVWSIEQTIRVSLGGLYPRIFLLRRV